MSLTYLSAFDSVKINTVAKIQSSEIASINPDQLFEGVICLAKTATFKTYFEYELSPNPTSMFVNNMKRRKSKKSRFMSLVSSGIIQCIELHDKSLNMIDDGYFLNSVVWPKLATFQEIVNINVSSAIKRYGAHSTIIFYG